MVSPEQGKQLWGEYYLGAIHEKEAQPASLREILARFGGEKKFDFSLLAVGKGFTPENFPPGEERRKYVCPHYDLVLLAFFLIGGKSDSRERERLDEILCGTIAHPEDTLGWAGPLSGRKGTDYQTFSQCWKLTSELGALVQFMETLEAPPAIDLEKGEDSLRESLGERKRITQENEQRLVIARRWLEIKEDWQSQIRSEPERPALEGERVAVRKKTTTPTIILTLGSEEYHQLLAWVREETLGPLSDLVGNNVFPPKDGKLRLGTEETAANCPRRPRGGFSGVIS